MKIKIKNPHNMAKKILIIIMGILLFLSLLLLLLIPINNINMKSTNKKDKGIMDWLMATSTPRPTPRSTGDSLFKSTPDSLFKSTPKPKSKSLFKSTPKSRPSLKKNYNKRR